MNAEQDPVLECRLLMKLLKKAEQKLKKLFLELKETKKNHQLECLCCACKCKSFSCVTKHLVDEGDIEDQIKLTKERIALLTDLILISKTRGSLRTTKEFALQEYNYQNSIIKECEKKILEAQQKIKPIKTMLDLLQKILPAE